MTELIDSETALRLAVENGGRFHGGGDFRSLIIPESCLPNLLNAAIKHVQDNQEPITTVKVWNEGGSGEFRTTEGVNSLPHGTKLFTFPPNQAAEVAKRDIGHLEWIYDRLATQLDQDTRIDFMIEFEKIISRLKTIGAKDD